MKHIFTIIILFATLLPSLRGQMWNGRDTLYGNEWIRYDQSYFKISVAEDGIYRLPAAVLAAAGLPVAGTAATRYQLFHLGEEVPLFSSTDGPLASGDYLEFYGEKNRSQLDRHLFRDPDNEMLNPEYSLVTDTSAYFLTIAPAGLTGRRYREVDNDLGNVPAREEWFWGEEKEVFSNRHLKKYQRISGVSIYYSNYEVAEGFGSKNGNELLRREGRVQQVMLEPAAVYGGGPDARLEARFACGLGPHRQVVRINGEQVVEDAFDGFQVRQPAVDVPAATLGGRLTLEFQGVYEDGQENQSLAFVRLRYPRQFDFGGEASYAFTLPAAAGPRYLEIANFDAGEAPVLYDLSSGLRLEAAVDGGIVRALLPAAPGERRLVLVNTGSGVTTADEVSPVQFTDFSEVSGDYLIISHTAFFNDGSGRNLVQEYADYRASAAGGSYRPLVIDVEQLYDQFGYGVARHPLGLRNFGQFAKREWPGLRYLFLIGKGREYTAIRSRQNLEVALEEKTFYLPSFGVPASDNLLFSSNESSVPVAPVGRIAATGPAEVAVYLEKVKEHEANNSNPQTIEARAWMKKVLHLGGGAQAGEQAFIRNSLEQMGNIVEQNRFGAEVIGFYKTSSDPIQGSVTERIFDHINDGTSIMTFFGHSSPGTFDFSIDNADNYQNNGRYPMMISLGCYSGNLFTRLQSISERFLFLKDRGAVAFGASRGVGFISALNVFAQQYYNLLGSTYYGLSIGEVLTKTLESFDSRTDLPMKTLVQQFSYHGDPALMLHPAPGPDYVVDAATATFEPRVITAQLDSFDLSFDIVNLGRNESEQIVVEVRQELPDGNILVAKRDTVTAPAFREPLVYTLPNPGRAAIGRNTFFVTVDADDQVSELPAPAAEQNNELVRASGEKGITLYVVDNTARPVFPADYAIVNTSPVALKASTTDATAPERTYVFEIDTTALFNSDLKQREAITQRGGVINWTPAVSMQDGTVYYWRVSPDSTDAEVGYVWEGRSFVYLPGEQEGWNQSHYYQYLDSEFEGLKLNGESREWVYDTTFTDFRIRNLVIFAGEGPQGFVNNSFLGEFFFWEVSQSISIVVFDTLGAFVRNPPPGQFGSLNTKLPFPSLVFPFPVRNSEDRNNIIKFLENIPDNYQVVVYTAQRTANLDLNVKEWQADSLTLEGKNLFNVLEAQGATQVRRLEEAMVPYIFAFRKNAGPIDEIIAADVLDQINFQISVPGPLPEGQASSVLIGPARSWERVEWDYEQVLYPESDSIRLQIYGVRQDGVTGELLAELESEKDIPLTNISGINSYPYLRLVLESRDSTYRTSPQLKYWRVFYEGLPDASVDPNTAFTFRADTLQRGEPLHLETAIVNLRPAGMDSLLVRFTIQDDANTLITTEQRLAPLAGDGSLVATFDYATEELAGANQLTLEVNPGGDQPELNTFNNLLVRDFFVATDQANPILDVTFDGTHIMDGDLVSARPLVVITLEDENRFLLLNDTADFQVQLQLPDGQTRRVGFDENLQFYPAEAGRNNRARIEWQPVFAEDGVYQLIVQASDRSGNKSGAQEYRKSFEVINKKSISNVFNYPNPFATATQFVYTMTGDEPPAFFTIQILTVSGRIVREITQDELGPLKVGTHRTDFVWDGTDEFGDRLANGVYLYRVIAKDESGKDYEKYENGTDRYFKGDFGKLVILR